MAVGCPEFCRPDGPGPFRRPNPWGVWGEALFCGRMSCDPYRGIRADCGGGERRRAEGAGVAIRVKCKCGKSLKVSSKLADKRIACPVCRFPFRIPAAKFQASPAGREKKTAAPAPTRPQVRTEAAAASPPAPAGPEPADLDMELLDELSGDFDQSQSDILSDIEHLSGAIATAAPPAAVAVASPGPAPLSYARDDRHVPARGSRLADPIQAPQRGFWADAFFSFIYPVRNGSNAITLGFILAASAVRVFLGFGGILGLGGSLIIFGWLASLYFSVIHETATGSDDLPGLNLEDGFLDGIIRPAIKYIGAYAVVLAPAALLGIVLALGGFPKSWSVLVPLWFAAGIFLLPIVFLLFALDALGMIVRIDLICSTIFRTILPYLAIWFVLLLVGAAFAVTTGGSVLVGWLMPDLASKLPVPGSLGFHLAANMFDTYFTIVAMRIIGIYYLHFKKRFTIVLE